MESKKRKREADVSPPRITFVTPSRTFERLFKETSLEATKATVLKKLGLDAGTTVELSQGRDGRTIDLEDEDDFDALRSYAFSKGGVEVRVTFPGSSKFAEPQKQPEVSVPEEPSARVQKKKKTSRMTASVVAPDAPSIPIGAPDTAAFPEEKDKRKSKTIEASALPSSPTAIPGAPASAALCGSTEAPAKKSKSKRKKKLSVPVCQTPPTSAAQVEEPPLEITKKKKRSKQVSAILPPEPGDGSIASASPKPNDDLSSLVDNQTKRLTQSAARFNLNPSAGLPSTAESLVHLPPTSGDPLKEKKKKDGKAKKKLVETDALPAVTAAPLFSTSNQISLPNLEEILKTAGPSQPTAPQAEEEKTKSEKVKASSRSKNKALASLESIEQPPLAAPATSEVSGVEKPKKKQVEDIQPSATPVVSTTKTSSSDTQKKKRKLPEASSAANPAASVETAKTKKRKIAEGVGNNVSIVPSGVPVPAGTSSVTFAAEVASAIASAGEANTPAKAKKAKKTKAATDGAHTSSDSLQTALDDVIDDVLRKARQRINATPESSSVSISTEPVSSAVRQFGERPSLATPDVSSHPDTAPQSAQTKTVTGKESKETKANSPPTPKPTPKPSVSLPGTPGTIKRMKDRFGRLASLNIVSDDLSLTQEGTSVNSPVPGEIDGIDESHAEFTPIIKPLRYNTPRSLSVDPSSQGTAVQELSKPTTQQRKEQRPPIVEEKERDNSPSIAGRLRRLKQKREVEVVIPLTSLSQVGHRKLICNPSLVGATSQPDSDSKIDQMVDIDSSKALDKRTSYARGMTPDNSEESTARVAAELEGKSASTTEVEGSINNDIRADDSPAVSPLPAAEGILGANLDLVRTASSASPDAGDFAEDSDADKGNVTGKQIHARAPRPSLNTFHGRVGAELERKSASTTEVEGSINDDIRADGSPAVLPLPAAEGILGANLDLVRTASSPSSDVGDSAEDSDADKGNVTGKQIHARAPHPSLNTFPSLNDIAARQDLFSPAATPHPSFPLAPVTSLASGTRGTGAGTGADDEESSSSGSDSDSDGQFSIPKEKRAGSKLSKPRKAFASLLSYLESRS